MKKLLIVSFITLFVLTYCRKESTELQTNETSSLSALKAHKNKNVLIANGDFNKHMDLESLKNNYGWTKQAYLMNTAVFSWAKKVGRNQTGGISLETTNGIANDIALTLAIVLDPTKFYRLVGWIKTENVESGAGANICIYGTWTKSGSVSGTSDWQKVELDVPINSKEVVIGCRLGYWAGSSTGKAYFDDLAIEAVNKFVATSQHIQLVLDGEDAAIVSNQTLTSWLVNLDKAYDKFFDLMGEYPYSGDKITILSTNTYPGGWAVAGNPILWYKPYIQQELQSIASTGTWSFGIMHELAHDFILENSNKNWIINEEMFANFRMFFVVDQLSAVIFQGGKLYTGAALENYYKTDAPENYATGIGKGIPVGYDGLMYTLIRIKNSIGWDPIIKAIRDLNSSSISPGTRTQMFYLLLDKISQYSGQNIRSTYPSGELLVIEQLLNKP
jgi:hypothetical protein